MQSTWNSFLTDKTYEYLIKKYITWKIIFSGLGNSHIEFISPSFEVYLTSL